MIKHYFKITIRRLFKQKTYSLTSILGLTVGLTASILIFLWMLDELSVDRFHTKADRIYKVLINDLYADGRMETYEAPTVMIGQALRTDIPEMDEVVQTSWSEGMLVKSGDKKFIETGLYADPGLFSLFSFPISSGNKLRPLSHINSISISEKLANKLFNGDPIGRTLTIDQLGDFMVSSVFEDIPQHSSLRFDFVISFENWKKQNSWANHWRSGATQAFVTLKSESAFNATDSKVRKIIQTHCSDCNREAFLYPFSQLYLHGKFENGKNSGGRISQVILFGCIAGIILIMACFNFTNLATARASTRTKEIGVRKSVGAGRISIGIQFIGESLFISFISLYFAIILVSVFLPILNEITGKSLHLDYSNPVLVLSLMGITLLCGVLAGLYPAFYLSALNTWTVLKNSKVRLKGGSFRKGLIVTQFAVSVMLITGSIGIYRQLGYIFKMDLGFSKENIIVIPQKEGLSHNYAPFKADLQQIPTVKNVALVGSNVFQVPITTTDPVWPGKPENSSISFKVLRSDDGFIPTMHIKLIAGRNFYSNRADSSNYIINEKAMLAMGLIKQNVIGTKLEMWNGKGEIIGLTEDFINGNLHQGTEPLILMFTTTNGFNYYIKTIENANINQTLASIEAIAKKYSPDYPFEYSFLEGDYSKEYKTESVLGKLSLGFTVVAVIVCCLGLFGLATFAAEQRIKEIGVRKVLGASVSDIVILLSKELAGLVFMAILVAIPTAYYFLNKWLEDFAYRIDISWWVLVLAGMSALMIALLTVSFQAIKAAVSNPVKSVRRE
ncbi:FtsX-like permease family protein [Rhodocytophaga rosea]|uniref:FtsX-like permease family protein n=1 Tax=Rhodocytophaga rosea TaxID=2704465 RepID=A0A6C0GGF1_9BACT|nr:ABC transporter permease [Rhodocytophaga rosea]QHT66989.1 FtsX-like permease family protein [Rhodocytophaga rosea]